MIDKAALAELVRSIVHEELARPEFISQRSVESVVGLPPRDFMRLAREGAFPSTKERRLIVARTAEVISYIASHLHASKPRSTVTDLDEALERVGARRIG